MKIKEYFMKKLLCLCIVLVSILFCFSGCTQPSEEHNCKSKCAYCDKCLNLNCEEEICAEKCTTIHTVAQFNSAYNLAGNIYYELLQFLYSDGTTTIYQARNGADSSNKSEYYGTWSKSDNAYTISINKLMPEGKRSQTDIINYNFTSITESGLGSDAVYYMDIVVSGVSRRTLMYKTAQITISDENVWLNERYKNSALSEDALLSEGNNEKYSPENVKPLENSPLSGKKICHLGSSVTYGLSAKSVSFVEYIDKRNGSISEKYAVSSTTLSDAKPNSYVERLKKIDTEKVFDIFVCQLSTNDASSDIPLGELSNDNNYNTKTICGAIEYIINYVKVTWNCPVVFYTNCFYEDDKYAQMVKLLKQITEKHDICLIDLYSDTEFNDITIEERFLYMNDKVHPQQAGYLEWWTPKFEEYLYELVK